MTENWILTIAIIVMAVVLSFFIDNVILIVTIWVMFGTSIIFLLTEKEEQ